MSQVQDVVSNTNHTEIEIMFTKSAILFTGVSLCVSSFVLVNSTSSHEITMYVRSIQSNLYNMGSSKNGGTPNIPKVSMFLFGVNMKTHGLKVYIASCLQRLVGGLEHFLFFHILGIIIPVD